MYFCSSRCSCAWEGAKAQHLPNNLCCLSHACKLPIPAIYVTKSRAFLGPPSSDLKSPKVLHLFHSTNGTDMHNSKSTSDDDDKLKMCMACFVLLLLGQTNNTSKNICCDVGPHLVVRSKLFCTCATEMMCDEPAYVKQLCLLQLTTQEGMTAGLEADQAAKLAHIDALKKDANALKSALHEEQLLTQAAESALDATRAELSHRDLVIEG